MSDFLSPPRELAGLLPADIALLSARFDVDAFDTSLYAQHGIGLQEKMLRAVAKRQAEYLAGRILADRLLRERGHPPHDLQPGEHRCPIWPAGFTGSISHSRHAVLCALADGRVYHGVGVDLESLDNAFRVESVRRQFVDTDEQALVDRSSIDDAMLLLAIFSAKESLFKALYPTVGRWFGFQSARFTEAGPPATAAEPFTSRFTVELALTEDLAEHATAGTRYTVMAGLTDEAVVTALAVPVVR